MKTNFLFVIYWILCSLGHSAIASTIYSPNTNGPLSSTGNFCQGTAGNSLNFKFFTCHAGTGTTAGVPITITWYQNNVNATTGGTIVSTTTSSCAAGDSSTITYAPATSVVGTSYYYCVISWSGAGTCNASGTLTSSAIQITVKPNPAPISGAATVCAGATTAFTGGASGAWSSSNVDIAAVSASGIVTGETAGSATIYYTALNGCSATAGITVKAAPGNITGNSTVCTGSTITLANSVSGGTWTGTPASVVSVNASTGVVTGTSAGNATISYTLSSGCSSTTDVAVMSTVPPIAGSTTVCTGLQTALIGAGSGTWTSSNLSVATVDSVTGIVTGVATGNVIINYTAACGTASANVNVVTNPGAPVVSMVSPSRGIATTPVTIGGTRFNATPAWNAGFFGATRCSMGGCSGTSLDVNIPKGATYTPVVVNNMECGLTAYAPNAFLPIFNNTSYAAGTVNFNAQVDITSGVHPLHIAVGDIDGDGKPDVAIVNYNSNSISVYRNTSLEGSITGSSFAGKVDFETGTEPYSVTIADIDGDGKPDMIVPNNVSNTVSVFHNNAIRGIINSKSFGARVDFATGVNPISVAVGDFDGDGKPDVATANFFSNTISVFRNLSPVGGVAFAPKVDLIAGSHPYCIAVGDIDGDSKPDIALTNNADNTVSLYRNNTTPGSFTTTSFAAAVNFATGTQPGGLALGDMDGDGRQDVVVVNLINRMVSVLRNTATSGVINAASLAPKVDFGAGVLPYNIALGDMDGDGKPDMVVSNYGNNRAGTQAVSIIRNTASIGSINSTSFEDKIDVVLNGNPRNVAIADIDGDNKPEIMVANLTANGLSILRNDPVLPIAGSNIVCAGGITSLSNTTNGGYWKTNNASVASVDSVSGIVTGITPGTATITYILAGGGRPTMSMTVVPPPAIAGTANICIGGTALLTDTARGGTWSTSDVDIAAINPVTGMVYGEGSGTATITYTTINGCKPTTTAVVRPVPSDIDGITTICLGDSKTLSNAVTGGTWSSSDASVASVNATSGVVTGVSNGTTVITYAVGSGCIATIPVTAVTTTPAISGNTNVCVGLQTALTDGGGGTWISSDPTIASVDGTGVVTGITPGRATISYSLTCGTVMTSVNVNRNTGVPVVTNVNPASGIPAYPVLISGANFSPTAASNINYFGATQGAVTSASSSVLTVNIPKGATYTPLTVNNADCGLTAYSTVPFLPVYDNSAFLPDTVNFTPQTDFISGVRPLHVAIGDLDGDGKPDIAAVNFNSNTVSVFRNTGGTGSVTPTSFGDKVDFTTGTEPYSVAIADMDGDGKADMVVTNNVSNTVSVFHNTATRGVIDINSFCRRKDFATGVNPISVAIADMDNDGKADIITANFYSNSISVIRNISPIGGVAFDPRIDLPSGVRPYGLAVGDIDGDGKIDIASTNNIDNNVAIFRNTTTGGVMSSSSFAPRVNFTTGTQPVSVAIGDIDGDGKPEVMVANMIDRMVSVFHNVSAPGSIDATSLEPKVDFVTGVLPYNIAIGDMDGDGKADMVVSNYGNSRAGTQAVSVFRNTSARGAINSSSFAAKIDKAVCGNPRYVAVGDMDGDDKPDMVVASLSTNAILVIKNSPLTGASGRHSAGAIVKEDNKENKKIVCSELKCELAVMPNPNSGVFAIKGNVGTADNEKVTVQITDMLGRSVYNEKVVAHNGSFNQQIDLNRGAVASGIYILNLQANAASKSFRMVIGD